MSRQFVRPNLLDNWYFVGGGSQQRGGQFPINQRGKTSYTTNNGKYSIDRWITRNNNSTLALNADGVTLTITTPAFTAIGQPIENGVQMLAGKTVTLSVLAECHSSTAFIEFGNATAANSVGTAYGVTEMQSGLTTVTVTLPSSFANQHLGCFVVAGSGNAKAGDYIKIIAAKLELGDTQTLAHQENGVWVLNEIPNYQKLLKRCQRFFMAFNHAGQSYCKPGNGYAKSGTAGLVLLPHPTMRAAPSVTYSGNWAMKDYSNNYRTVSAMSRDVATAVGTSLNITSSSMSSGRIYTLTANNDSTANIYLSADL